MIKIYETFRSKNEHAVVNGILTNIIGKIYKNDKIEIYAQKNHIGIIKKYIDTDNVRYKDITVVGTDSKIRIFFHYIVSAWQDIILYILSSSKDKLFYFSINPLSILTLKILNRIMKKKIYMVCHGELEHLIEENHRYLPKHYRMIAKIYKFSFYKIKNDYIDYIVLGESIKNNVAELFKEKLDVNKFIAIDIPYDYQDIKIQEKLDKKLLFSSVGVASTAKGTEKIFNIAKKIKKDNNSKEINFSIIGKMTDSMEKYKNEFVIYSNDNKMKSRDEFEAEIEKIDYVLYFYPNDAYKLIASGAFFDAISFEKPIIAIENDFFKYYFDRFGEIGYLCKGEEEVENIIKMVIKNNSNYEILKNNIKKAKMELSQEKILNDLKIKMGEKI